MSPRRLSDDEHTLWKGVTRSIAPLRKSRSARIEEAVPAASEAPTKTRLKTSTKAAPAAAVAAQAVPSPRPTAPPLATLDRRTKRRVGRGSHAIDGRLDLHGLTQAEAYDALIGFLHARQSRGCKLVLVITGKGARGEAHGGRGVLKRLVPLWLGMAELRSVVVGYESASVRHGGEGALYVRLRRGRED
jgi:DNA-nicking Smr family endonuclease